MAIIAQLAGPEMRPAEVTEQSGASFLVAPHVIVEPLFSALVLTTAATTIITALVLRRLLPSSR